MTYFSSALQSILFWLRLSGPCLRHCSNVLLITEWLIPVFRDTTEIASPASTNCTALNFSSILNLAMITAPAQVGFIVQLLGCSTPWLPVADLLCNDKGNTRIAPVFAMCFCSRRPALAISRRGNPLWLPVADLLCNDIGNTRIAPVFAMCFCSLQSALVISRRRIPPWLPVADLLCLPLLKLTSKILLWIPIFPSHKGEIYAFLNLIIPNPVHIL